jgi:hypothetical protein
LAEGQPKVRMGDHVEKEFAVSPAVDKLCGGRAT